MSSIEKADGAFEIEGIFGNQAAGGGDVGRVQRGEARVAAEDAENADALVRAERGALARDGFLGAGDGGGKSDAIFGALDVVVHGLGNADHGKAGCGKHRGEAQRVVAADGDQATDAERLEIVDHDRGEIVILAVEAQLFQAIGERCVREACDSVHAPGIGARGVQHRAAGAVDGVRVFAGKLADIGGIGEVCRD